MSEHFGAAVDWVETQLRPLAFAGFLSKGREPFYPTRDELLVRAEIGYWHFGSERIPNVMTDLQAAQLWRLCQVRRGAFDMARHAAASYIQCGWPMPEGLQSFAAMHLAGQLVEPPIERRDKTFFRRFVLYTYSYWAARAFLLDMTRNDGAKRKESACDAVNLALERCGVHTSERAVKDICLGVHGPERDLRDWVHREFVPAVDAFWRRNSAVKPAPVWKKVKLPVMIGGV